MDQHLLVVFLSIEDTVNPNQFSKYTCTNAAPNMQGVDGCTRVQLVSTSSELTALLDTF